MKRHVAGTVLIALLITGCGSGDGGRATTVKTAEASRGASDAVPTRAGSSTASTATASETPQTEISESKLKTALLSLDEMPTGFTLGDPTDDDDGKAQAGDDACAKRFDDLDKLGEGVKTAKAERDFMKGAGLSGSFLNQSLSAYKNKADATKMISAAINVLSECPKFVDVDEQGEKTTFTLKPLSFPKVGDQTFATAMTGSTKDLDISGQLVINRVGSVVQLVGHLGLMGADVDVTDKVVRRGVAKLEEIQ